MEYIGIVDSQDVVVGSASFDEIYKKRLPHRIVHVLLFNEEGEMALQLRSEKKIILPPALEYECGRSCAVR